MKEFVTAVEDFGTDIARKAQIDALVAQGKSPEEAEAEVEGLFTAFKLDGREMRAYPPTDGQLTFMLAVLGRGQTDDQRYAGIVNLMLAALRSDDADYLESRLLSSDRRKRLPLKQLEAIFEFLVQEWFREDVPSGSTSE